MVSRFGFNSHPSFDVAFLYEILTEYLGLVGSYQVEKYQIKYAKDVVCL